MSRRQLLEFQYGGFGYRNDCHPEHSRQSSHSETRAPVQQSLITRRRCTDSRLADIRFGV